MLDNTLIIDVATIINQKKINCFYPLVIKSLLQFKKNNFNFFVFNSYKKNNSQIKWVQDFFNQEGISLKLLSLQKIKNNTPSLPILVTLPENIKDIYNELKHNKIVFLLSNSSNKKEHLKLSPSLGQISYYDNWNSFTKNLLFPKRIVKIHRKTSETDITLKMNLDGNGKARVNTELSFFDHMLTNFAKHSSIDLEIKVKGDLEVDEHHTIEDTAIVLGQAFKQALGNKRGISRYGFVLPMDESEVACSIDFSGRSYLVWKQIKFKREYVGDFPTEMVKHFFNSFSVAAELNMHIKITGKNEHHMIEASFKSLAKCIKQAIAITSNDIPSTKGSL